jgi:hypothetical protein
VRLRTTSTLSASALDEAPACGDREREREEEREREREREERERERDREEEGERERDRDERFDFDCAVDVDGGAPDDFSSDVVVVGAADSFVISVFASPSCVSAILSVVSVDMVAADGWTSNAIRGLIAI